MLFFIIDSNKAEYVRRNLLMVLIISVAPRPRRASNQRRWPWSELLWPRPRWKHQQRSNLRLAGPPSHGKMPAMVTIDNESIVYAVVRIFGTPCHIVMASWYGNAFRIISAICMRLWWSCAFYCHWTGCWTHAQSSCMWFGSARDLSLQCILRFMRTL